MMLSLSIDHGFPQTSLHMTQHSRVVRWLAYVSLLARAQTVCGGVAPTPARHCSCVIPSPASLGHQDSAR